MSNYKEWATAISTPHTDYETLNRYSSCNIKAVELSVGWDKIDQINWEEFRANADKAGIEICSYHLPFCGSVNIASLNWESRYTTAFIHSSLIEKACNVGIKRFVVHPSAEPIADNDRAASMDAAKQTLHKLADVAEKFGAVICAQVQ